MSKINEDSELEEVSKNGDTKIAKMDGYGIGQTGIMHKPKGTQDDGHGHGHGDAHGEKKEAIGGGSIIKLH